MSTLSIMGSRTHTRVDYALSCFETAYHLDRERNITKLYKTARFVERKLQKRSECVLCASGLFCSRFNFCIKLHIVMYDWHSLNPFGILFALSPL